MPDPSPTKPSLLRRVWRWLRWFMLIAVLSLALLAVFHRSIILWALNSYGSSAAKHAGIELAWAVEGSLWSDLGIKGLRITGTGATPLAQLTAGRVALNYDTQALWQGRYMQAVKGIVLHDVAATIDLRDAKPEPADKAKSASDPKALLDLLRQIQWPDIDIRNVDVTVLQKDATLYLHGLSLVVPAGKPGTLRLASLEHPAFSQAPIGDVSANIALAGTAIAITDLQVPSLLSSSRIAVDAAKADGEGIALDVELHSGAAAISIKGLADVLHERQMQLDLVLDISDVREAEVKRWLPADGPPWHGDLKSLHIVMKGDPRQPKQVAASLDMRLEGPGWDAWKADAVVIALTVAKEKLSVPSIRIEAAGNRFEVSTESSLRAEWPDCAQVPFSLHWKLAAPALDQVAGLPMKLGGTIQGSGDVDIEGCALHRFTADLSAHDVVADAHRLHLLEANAAGDMKAIAFKATARIAPTEAEGGMSLDGHLGLAPGKPSDVAWAITVPQPQALVSMLRLAWPADISTGALTAKGSAAFTLDDLKAARYEAAKGQGTIAVQQVTWRAAPCERVALSWSLAAGKAKLESLDVILPEGSAIHASGDLMLEGQQPFNAAVDVHIPKLAGLSAWLAAAGAKQLKDGTIALNWKGKGSLRDGLKLGGNVALKVTALQADKLPQPVSLETTLSHSLAEAKIHALTATMGAWQTVLRATASQSRVQLHDFQLRNTGKLLATLCADVPLALPGADAAGKSKLPLDSQRPLHLLLATADKLDLAELAKLAGTALPPDIAGKMSTRVEVDGTLAALRAQVEVHSSELRLPQVPKSQAPGHVDMSLTLANDVLRIEASAAVKPLEPLYVEGVVRLSPQTLLDNSLALRDAPFQLSAHLDQPSLGFIKNLVPALREIQGSLAVNLEASGTAAKPVLNGKITVDLPTVVMQSAALPEIKKLKVSMVGEGTSVKIENFTGSIAGGDFALSGNVGLADTSKPQFDLAITAKDLLIKRDETLSLRTDADIQLKGPLDAAVLTGGMGLTRGRVYKEIEFLPLSKLMNDLPPMPETATAKAAKAAAQTNTNVLGLPPMLDGWSFDFAVKTKDPIRLLGNVLNGGVNVDVKLAGTGKAPLLSGGVILTGARLRLPFSTLRITTGNVTIDPEKPLAPKLDLTAEASVDAYEIVLRGYGAALDPKLRFSSTPPLPEGEIATLLATGSTTAGLKTAGENAAGRAAFLLIRQAYRAVFKSKSNPVRNEDTVEPKFKVQERSENGELGGVTGIYEFSPKMKVVGSTDKDGGFRAMLHYLFRFR